MILHLFHSIWSICTVKNFLFRKFQKKLYLATYLRNNSGWDVYVAKINLLTGLVIKEVRGNFSITGDQVDPRLTALSDGRTLLTWSESGSITKLFGRFIDTEGNFTSVDLDLGIEGYGYEITKTTDGGFLVIHRDGDNVKVSRFDDNAELMETTGVVTPRPFSSGSSQLR